MERLSAIYASALFDLALQNNAVDDYIAQAKFLHETLSNEEVERMLDNPQITTKQKHVFFNTVFGGKLHKDLLSFLFLVTEKNREKFLLPALTALISNIERHNKIVKAKVLSAAPYDNTQAESLRAMLSLKLKKTVELELKVDPNLIGGPYIFADGYHIDWTIKKRLHDLSANLKEGCSA